MTLKFVGIVSLLLLTRTSLQSSVNILRHVGYFTMFYTPILPVQLCLVTCLFSAGIPEVCTSLRCRCCSTSLRMLFTIHREFASAS